VSVAAVTPGLVDWVRRWGISVASLVGGLLTLFVFRRGLPHVRFIVGYVLLLWLLAALIVEVHDSLAASPRRVARLALTAGEYTIQTLFHGILLFLIPAYYAAATLGSVNVVFLGLLIALALLATFDPWYSAVVRAVPSIRHVFFVVSIFGALNIALPLVDVPPARALVLSAWTAIVALTPAVHRAWRRSWIVALAATALLGVGGAALVSARRAWIPPAPLFLASRSLAWVNASVDSMEPNASAIPDGELQRRGLIAYTAIFAPAGLRQPVDHVWRRNGRKVDVVRLTPVEGGRRDGYRTFSRKTAFPAASVGRWTVDVVTAGQLIGRLSFRVVP